MWTSADCSGEALFYRRGRGGGAEDAEARALLGALCVFSAISAVVFLGRRRKIGTRTWRRPTFRMSQERGERTSPSVR